MDITEQFKILEACKEGKPIQVKLRHNIDIWSDIKNNHIFNFVDNDYRIKPEIVLPKSWREYCNSNTRIDKFFIDENSRISVCSSTDKLDIIADRNLCDSNEEAEAFRALMQLRLLRKAYIDDWEADFTNGKPKFCICNACNNIFICNYSKTNHSLSFPTKEIAQKFLDNFKGIIELAKPLI